LAFDDGRRWCIHLVDDHDGGFAHVPIPRREQLGDVYGAVRKSSSDRRDRPDPHTPTDPDSEAHAGPNTEADPDPNTETNAKADTEADADPDPHAETDPETDPEAYSDPEADSHTDREGGRHEDPDPHREADGAAEAHRSACRRTVGHSRSIRGGDGGRRDSDADPIWGGWRPGCCDRPRERHTWRSGR
jgi:hypothetical protein